MDSNGWNGIGSMASGIKEGLIAFQTKKNMENQERQFNLLHGVQGYDQNNQPIYTPEEQQKRGLLAKQQQSEMDAFDANSQDSKNALGLLNQATHKNYQNLSAKQIKDLAPIIDQSQKNEGLISAANIRGEHQGDSLDLRKNTQNYRIHKDAVNTIINNQQLNDLQKTMQNLDNAKRNFVKGGATTQDFAELQQAVASNAGIKGSSGVGERQERYLTSLGLNASKVKQFLSGEPQSVLKSDPSFAKQILHLVDLEQENKQKQAMGQMNTLKAKYGSFYKDPAHADLLEDFNNSISGKYSQFGLGSDGAPQGSQGLIGQKDDTAQDPQISKWAQDHKMDYSTAAAIIAKRKAAMGGR